MSLMGTLRTVNPGASTVRASLPDHSGGIENHPGARVDHRTSAACAAALGDAATRVIVCES
jgi:hypothetical protein